MNRQVRYAVYFTPQQGSRWWQFGCEWLGRDPISGRDLTQPRVPGMTSSRLAELTELPRRYAFHATLKAPFALAGGSNAEDVYRTAAAVARNRESIELGAMSLHRVRQFLALEPVTFPRGLRRLADDCVGAFDGLRAPAQPAETARRASAGLTPRQESLLARWGYPYVMDEWRFHMTLTRELAEIEHARVFPWLSARLRQLNAEPMMADAICVFEQAGPAAPFRLTRRFGFDGIETAYCDGRRRGRLFYLIGASGAGKDSLLGYARRRMSGRSLAIAHRYITRVPTPDGENHVALSDDEFDVRVNSGAFALHWDGNGHLYGIGVEIDGWLARGLDVIVNGSRAYLDWARLRYPELKPVWVEAAPAVLRERLARRGREPLDAIEARIDRAGAYGPPEDALVIENNGPIEESGERLVRELTGAANDAAIRSAG